MTVTITGSSGNTFAGNRVAADDDVCAPMVVQANALLTRARAQVWRQPLGLSTVADAVRELRTPQTSGVAGASGDACGPGANQPTT